MSAPAKSSTPAVESRDWTKATTPELLSSSEDESSVLNMKAKEHHRCKQVRREERQRWEAEARRACEEVERKAREEAERAKAEVEQRAREEAEHKACEQVEKERAESQARAELQQRKVVEEAVKQRAVEEDNGTRGVKKESERGTGGKSGRRGLVRFILFYFCFCFANFFL